MKKILFIVSILFLFTGCFNSKVNQEKRDNINDSISSIEIDNQKIFENTKIIDQNTLLTDFGLTKKEVKDFVIGVPTIFNKTEIYVAIKPARKYKKFVDEKINNYLENAKMILIDNTDTLSLEEQEKAKKDIENKFSNKTKTEINGYLIYIISSDNNKVLNIYKKNLK